MARRTFRMYAEFQISSIVWTFKDIGAPCSVIKSVVTQQIRAVPSGPTQRCWNGRAQNVFDISKLPIGSGTGPYLTNATGVPRYLTNGTGVPTASPFFLF